MKRNNIILGGVLVCLSLVISGIIGINQCQALPQDAKAVDYQLSGNVTSPVSKTESTVIANTTETLADPVNHPIVLTITLRDSSGNPLPDKNVTVESNRGSADIIEAVDKIEKYKAYAAGDSKINSTISDKKGQALIRVTSFIPGTAKLTAVADTITFNPIEVKFLALPFPSTMTFSIDLPFTSRDAVLYEPAKINENQLSTSQKEAMKLYNSGSFVKIPFWIFVIFVLVSIVSPILVIINFINIWRLRRTESDQSKMLARSLNNR